MNILRSFFLCFVCIIYFIFLVNSSAIAQPFNCNVCSACKDICDNTGCDSDECLNCVNASSPGGCFGVIPIDGGLIWLILGGVGVGVKSIVSRRRNDKGENQ